MNWSVLPYEVSLCPRRFSTKVELKKPQASGVLLVLVLPSRAKLTLKISARIPRGFGEVSAILFFPKQTLLLNGVLLWLICWFGRARPWPSLQASLGCSLSSLSSLSTLSSLSSLA